MSRRNFDLKSILDIPQWEKVQDQLAAATGTAIITVDYKGTPITKHSARTEFCGVIRENPVSRKRCYKCDSLAGLKAVRLNRPFIYLCHCGIVDVAVPVSVDDRYLGAVMFGQVRLPNGSSETKVERLVNEISSFSPENDHAAEELRELYNKLPEMEYERIQRIADLLNAIVQYIVNKALEHDAENMSYEWLLSSMSESRADRRGVPVEIQGLNREVNPIPSIGNNNVPKGSPIYPAVAYINDNPDKMVKMQDMAELCHLSPSYFSRLFLRESGENFIDYVNRRKIESAKNMLKSTSFSVTYISNALGFQDPSYFVKLFRKYEGVTPLMFKKQKSSR